MLYYIYIGGGDREKVLLHLTPRSTCLISVTPVLKLLFLNIYVYSCLIEEFNMDLLVIVYTGIITSVHLVGCTPKKIGRGCKTTLSYLTCKQT